VITSRSSTISQDIPIPVPPFYGRRAISDFSLEEIFQFLNEAALFRTQWGIRGIRKEQYLQLIEEKYRPLLQELKAEVMREGYFQPQAVYGYFACQSRGNDLIIYSPSDGQHEISRFRFPRQAKEPHLCIADYFCSAESGKEDVVAISLVTIGRRATDIARDLLARDDYARYLYLHGLSAESAEALAECMHRRIRRELNIAQKDSPVIELLIKQHYQGRRYSVGYGACPNLEDQRKIFDLLYPEEIGVQLNEAYQLVPEQSTSAIVAHHPQARYFTV